MLFWSTVFDASITETVADSIDYSVDGNILEYGGVPNVIQSREDS